MVMPTSARPVSTFMLSQLLANEDDQLGVGFKVR